MENALLASHPFLWAVIGLLAFAAGLLRGFSGFGSSLLVVPVFSLFAGPAPAVAVATLLECVATLLLFVPALQHTNKPALIPISSAASLAIPLGHFTLIHLNPNLTNVLISAAVALMSGWMIVGGRFQFPRNMAGKVSAGALSGFLTGFGGIGGPPLVLYVLSGSESAEIKRANVITISGVALIAAIFSMLYFGLLNRDALLGGIALAPIFLLGGMAGSRLFRAAPEKIYQRVAVGSLAGLSLLTLLANVIRLQS